jgi:hypothetical protein
MEKIQHNNVIVTLIIGLLTLAAVSTVAINNLPIAQAVGSGPGTPNGSPYGGLVSSEAQTGQGGFGQDLKDCRASGGCQGDGNNGLHDIRANDQAGGNKAGTTRDEAASP